MTSPAIQYARPSLSDLDSNIPGVLKSSRQFLAWNLEFDSKKVPLSEDGHRWGNYTNPKCWRSFDDVVDLIDRGRAFGIGLVLPSPEQIETLPDFKLTAGLVALDGDAKRSSMAEPYRIPANISDYVSSVQSYCEFSPSLKGLRALAFGELPTTKQSLRKSFGDGTELSLYRGGWVTLSGLTCRDSVPTIENRQDALDDIVKHLWPSQTTFPGSRPMLATSLDSASLGECFVLDWSRTTTDNVIRQFVGGLNRTQRQLNEIVATWELRRGWNNGTIPDQSMYTKRILEEALWLKPYFHWTLQDVVDIVVTFCKKHGLEWSTGRANKQIADGQAYVSAGRSTQVAMYRQLESCPSELIPHILLTCNSSHNIDAEIHDAIPLLTASKDNELRRTPSLILRDTFTANTPGGGNEKVSRAFKNRSSPRDTVLQIVTMYRCWVKTATIAARLGMSTGAAKKQLQRLRRAGLLDGDGNGRYRLHRERRQRKLKPCIAKMIPKARGTGTERKMLSRGELVERGWPGRLIDKVFPVSGMDYIARDVQIPTLGRMVNTRLYWVSRIKIIEGEPWFEELRMKHHCAEKKQPKRVCLPS